MLIRVVAGGVVGAIVALGATLALQEYRRQTDPCLGRCGAGTYCQLGSCRPSPFAPPPPIAPATPPSGKPKRLAPVAVKEKPPVIGGPRAEDLRPRAEGDELSRPVTRIDYAAADGKAELEQEDLDNVLDRRRGDLERCVADAAIGLPPGSGRVLLSFRVEASGEVHGVRVEAPERLLKHDLLACLRVQVEPLRFPKSGRSTLARYGFEIR